MSPEIIALASQPSGRAPRATTRRRPGTEAFSREQESLAAVVGRLLCDRRQTLAVAESCTGGLLSAQITAEPGASRFFLGAVVCYHNRVKHDALGVPLSTLRRFGAVSAPSTRALARGVRNRLQSDWSIAITGIAGPGGGSAAKPVGTVFIAVEGPRAPAMPHRFLFRGDRGAVRQASVHHALDLLRRRLMDQPVG